MPHWDFVCETCYTTNELSFSTYLESTRAKCPKCKKLLKRLPSVVQATFNGAGFYKTDYKRNKNAS